MRLIAAALVVGAGCVALGLWQMERLGQRQERNDAITRNAGASPVPLESVARVGHELPESRQWTKIRTTGRYDERRQLLVRNRVLQGSAGYHVLTPLVTTEGRGLLVNRGWIPSGETARTRPDVPAPPAGRVTVIARLRQSEPPAGGASAPRGEIRRIDVPKIAKTLPYDLYGGFGELVSEDPRPARAPRPLPAPEPSVGPHLAYAFQWFVFGLIAVAGVALLARREAQDAEGEPHRVGAGARG